MSEPRKKISVARVSTGARHTVTIPLVLEDEAGNVETIEARVVYRGISLKDGELLDEELGKLKTVREQNIFALSSVVIALPDFVDEGGEPVKPTAEFFDTLDTAVLNRIDQAIQDDRSPNAKRSSS